MVSEPGSSNKKLFAYIKDMKLDSSGVAPLKKDGINYSVKAKCYKSIVHRQLEYASTVWDSVTKSNIAKAESVQRRAARFSYKDYHQTSSVTSLLQELGWENF